MNNDETWDNFIPTTTKDTSVADNNGRVMAWEFLSPVPSFSGRMSVDCYGQCMTKVRAKKMASFCLVFLTECHQYDLTSLT